MTDKPESLRVVTAAADVTPATASVSQRTISGLAVPYGPTGNSSAGAITFSQGSLTWTGTGRVKLLLQHDPERVLGYATKLEERPDGLWAEFSVPESEEGDKALVEAADGRRDGLSVGVMLDQETISALMEKWATGDDSPTPASGELLEVSQVSIPAFRDSRIDGSAAASLSGHVTLSVAFGGDVSNNHEVQTSTPSKEETMSEIETVSPQVPEVETPAAAPAAFAGAAVTGGREAPVYTFDGKGASFVRDVFHARFSNDHEAADRLQKFQRRMAANDATQVGMLTAAVETRTTAPNFINQGYRPDMLVEVIDKGRPLVSRIGTTGLTDATPFRLPVEGEMTGGVGDHTEGTAHVSEGDLALSDVTVTPGAISGAFRLSRELVDASNPALDKIALNAMLRQYRYATEAKVVAALAAADSVADVSINSVQKLRQSLNSYYDLMLEDASGVAAHPGFYNALLGDVDTTGRPMLASVNPANAAGVPLAGHTGASVDGVEVFKAYAVSANDAYLYRAEDVFIGESAIQTFRFDEVEGPGVIKLALWSYFVAKVTRAGSVVKITSAGTD